MWLRGGTGEHGLHSLNFQGVGLYPPWMQQRLDPTLLGNDPNQQYQAMFASGMQNLGGGDLLRHQVMQFQQPFQYVQQPGSHTSLLQQQQQQHQQHQAVPLNILQAQTQVLTENTPQHLMQQPLNNQQEEQARQQQQQQQQHTYQNTLNIRSDQLHQRLQSNVPSSSFVKTDFMDPSTKFSTSITPRQNMVGSLCSEGSGNILNFSRVGQSMLAEQLPQQSWPPKYTHSQVNAFANSMSHSPYHGKDATEEPENCNSDSQNPTLFGVNIDSSGLLLPATVSAYATSVDADVSSMPLGDSGFQNSLYSSVQDSSELLHSAGQVDPPTPSPTFVKVCAPLGSFNLLLFLLA